MYLKTSDQHKLELGFHGYSCNWGVHICGLYETAEERDAIILGFFRQGIRVGDLQLYCPAERTIDDFKAVMNGHCPDCVSRLDDPDIFQYYSAKDLYYPDGKFSPAAMDIGLNGFFGSSQKKGPRNIRASAEMVWALEAIPGIDLLMVYESRLNYFIPGKPWISICMYNVRKFSGAIIMEVLRTHPFVISKGIMTENPYYIPPEKWLKDNAPEYLPRGLT